jgi:hypothetical protein
MIGFNSFSNASGIACFAVSAQSQVDALPTEWRSLPDEPSTVTSNDRPVSSSCANLAAVSHASNVDVTSTSDPLDRGELEQAKQVVKPEAQGMLKAAARQLHDITSDIYRHVLQSRGWTKPAAMTIR